MPPPLLSLYRRNPSAINSIAVLASRALLETTPTSQTRILRSRYEDQERVFSAAFRVLAEGIKERAFPGASICVTQREDLVALKALGRFTYEKDSPAILSETIFDLASVSKVVATTTMAMLLYERGFLDLEAPVVGMVPEFRREDSRRSEVTLRHLLAHSSGLPAYERLFLRAKKRNELLQEAFNVPLLHDPATHAEYSDVGFIVLGVALERIAGEGLDQFCQREIFGPLGMSHTAYNPPGSWRSAIPPTADDQSFRHRIIQGEVNDENASVMGGVAGHAGVFGTALDVASFANAMLKGGTSIIHSETVALFTRRQDSPIGTSRALGWDTPSAPSQAGKYFSSSSFGHLGYTGTSLWIDPERQISVTLLTNRTWPDSANKAIKEIRPKFHDAVMKALGATA